MCWRYRYSFMARKCTIWNQMIPKRTTRGGSRGCSSYNEHGYKVLLRRPSPSPIFLHTNQWWTNPLTSTVISRFLLQQAYPVDHKTKKMIRTCTCTLRGGYVFLFFFVTFHEGWKVATLRVKLSPMVSFLEVTSYF